MVECLPHQEKEWVEVFQRNVEVQNKHLMICKEITQMLLEIMVKQVQKYQKQENHFKSTKNANGKQKRVCVSSCYGFGGHTNWRCKLLVSGGVTRGRVARNVIGDDVTKGHAVPSASAETTQSGTEQGPQQGGRPLSISED